MKRRYMISNGKPILDIRQENCSRSFVGRCDINRNLTTRENTQAKSLVCVLDYGITDKEFISNEARIDILKSILTDKLQKPTTVLLSTGNYKAQLDYSIINADTYEELQSMSVKIPVAASDIYTTQGISFDNRIMSSMITEFRGLFELALPYKRSLGIIQHPENCKNAKFVINRLSLMMEVVEITAEMMEDIDAGRYTPTEADIVSVLNMILPKRTMLSTAEENQRYTLIKKLNNSAWYDREFIEIFEVTNEDEQLANINGVHFQYGMRSLDLNINIKLDNYMTIYDNSEIIDILKQNALPPAPPATEPEEPIPDPEPENPEENTDPENPSEGNNTGGESGTNTPSTGDNTEPTEPDTTGKEENNEDSSQTSSTESETTEPQQTTTSTTLTEEEQEFYQY